MNLFFKNVFSSCLGVFLALVAGIGLLVLFGISAAATGGGKPKLKDKTVLELRFDKALPQLANNVDRSFTEGTDDLMSVHDYIEVLEHAKNDKKIKGAVLYLSNGASFSGFAAAQAVRNAILDFKSAGKFVYAYADEYSRGAVYIGTAADSVFVNPMGGMEFSGFAAVYPFYKDLFDQIGVKPQVYFAGKFKGATESYRLNALSDENRLQIRAYLDTLYHHYLVDISATRKIPMADLYQMADNLSVRTATKAVQLGLADRVAYETDVDITLHKKLGVKPKDKIEMMSVEEYAKTYKHKPKYEGKDKIAVVFCEGPIMGGEEDKNGIVTQTPYIDIFKRLAEDEKVKAIVLRISSPGGSALTSEVLHQEIGRCKKAGKKVVVSMGDVAASGGYYMACNADSIFAELNTITGSIGVFTFIPGTQKLFEEKLFIHYDTVKTGKFATLFSGAYNHSEAEGQIIQESVDTMYQIFLSRVAEGRKLSKDSVHTLAQGRVWSSTAALQNGLVDRIGGLDAAIQCAARMAGTTKFKIKNYPTPVDPIQAIIKKITGQEQAQTMAQNLLAKELGPLYPHYATLRQLALEKGPQTRFLWEFPFK